MKILKKRSFCPISCALDVIGDKWSLLIVRDILSRTKRTHGAFRASDEKIATNILADRLAWLEQEAIIVKAPDPQDGRSEIFSLTEKGVDLLPVLAALAAWSAKHDPSFAADPLAGRLERLLADLQDMGADHAAGADLSAGRKVF